MTTPVRRLDQTRAARQPNLRWTPGSPLLSGAAASRDAPGRRPPPDATHGPTWRLLVTEPLDGAANMALDEALLRGRVQGSGAPT